MAKLINIDSAKDIFTVDAGDYVVNVNEYALKELYPELFAEHYAAIVDGFFEALFGEEA